MNKIIIQLICEDQVGIIAQLSSIILDSNSNILSIEQHVDKNENKFYIRLLVDIEKINIEYNSLKEKLIKSFAMQDRAKLVIPGMSQFLSKRPDMWSLGVWPGYFSKAKGCKIWDLDGKKYIDMSIMGIGTNILGYGHPEVDEAVRSVVDQGNMSTFNCPEEVYLAERLVELHPWAEMVRC